MKTEKGCQTGTLTIMATLHLKRKKKMVAKPKTLGDVGVGLEGV